jgi:GTP-binding protein EngB required for normal cell division
MIDWLKETEKPFLLAFTKADKLSRSKQHRLFERLESEGTLVDISFVPFSATSGQGRKDVLEWIDEVLQDAKTRR